MFKKIFAIATLLCALPVLANAFTLTTWVKSQGGTMDSPVKMGQAVINGSLSKTFTNASTCYVKPIAGWKISKLEKNGMVQTLTPAQQINPALPVRMIPNGVSNVSLFATFARQSMAIAAVAGSNGTISGKSSYNPVYLGLQDPPKTVVFRPNPGFAATITVTGGAMVQNTDWQLLDASTGAVISGLSGAVNQNVKVVIANVNAIGSITVSASFSGAVSNPTPIVGGQAATIRNACVNCHATQGVGGGYAVGAVYNNWSTSALKASGTMCYDCHVGANTGGHPGNIGNDCVGCHDVAIPNHLGNVNDNNNGVRAIVQEFSKWSHHVTGVTLNNAHCAACHLEGKAVGNAIYVDPTYHMADNMVHLRNADNDGDMQWNPAAPNHSTMDTYCMSCHDANGATSTGNQAVQALINATGIAAPGKTASAKNPFGDTISNRYDKMQRPGVVNVDSQFDTTNNSHHGVKGPRYSGRTRIAGPRSVNSAAFAANSSATLWGKRSTIYDGVDAVTGVTGGAKEAFNALYVPLANAGGETAPRTGNLGLGDDSTLHCGDCHTVGQWKPGTAQGYTPTDPATIIAGTSPAIGTHGSNNEYLLRNSKGIDERHTQDAYVTTAGVTTIQNPNAAFLVCFNCHSYERYGSVYSATGSTGPHAGEYDAAGRCNGIGNNIPFNGYTTGKATNGTQFLPRLGKGSLAALSSTPAFAPGNPLNFAHAPGGVQAATYTGEQSADFGNVFGIQCLNCHNSGVGNGYGGIHGSANDSEGTSNSGTPPVAAPAGGAFVNGMGNWSKVERFLPGLGNVMHVAGTLGGVTGGTTYGPITNSAATYSIQMGGVMNDTNWEQVAWSQSTTTGPTNNAVDRRGAGCYTIPIGDATSYLAPTEGLEGQPVGGEGSAAVEVENNWGACDDHQGSPTAGTTTRGAGNHGFLKRINRPITY